MSWNRFSRRSFLFSATAAAAGRSLLPQHLWAALPVPRATNPLEEQIGKFIAAYMPAMNAPGLTLGMTGSSSEVWVAGYGFADVDKRIAVTPDHLFQIGSITKSFVALVLLQLREEGKLDLHRPVLEYLPGLPIVSEFGAITAHHLLTHTSGLPDNLGLFSSDPNARLIQGFKPGEHFHYCNAGFDILGLLIAKLDGRPWRIAVQERILDPLGMNATAPVLTTSSRARSAVGYEPFWDDQVYPRQGRLAAAPNLVTDDTAGCIASTPRDMTSYLRMLLNRGQGPHGRIISAESFALLSTPQIKAREFSATSSYGYGIAVDTLDGHTILRHTGGMVSFASSIHVDLDSGVAAFASINAMQGYRPTAVTEYAVRLLRAHRDSRQLLLPPPAEDPQRIENASEYGGEFTAADGRKLVFTASGGGLSLLHEGASIPLQHTRGDSFLSADETAFATYSFTFGRKSEAASGASKKSSAQQPVVEVAYGPDWFVNADYSGATTFKVSPELATFAGHYRSDSPWGGDTRVYILKDHLVADGMRLSPIGGALFRVGDEAWSPETVEFLRIFEGKARIMRFAGMDFWRIDVD